LSGLGQRLIDAVDSSDLPAALGQVNGIASSPAAYVEGSTWRQPVWAFDDSPPGRRDFPPLPGGEPQPVQKPVGSHFDLLAGSRFMLTFSSRSVDGVTNKLPLRVRSD